MKKISSYFNTVAEFCNNRHPGALLGGGGGFAWGALLGGGVAAVTSAAVMAPIALVGTGVGLAIGIHADRKDARQQAAQAPTP